MRKKVRKFSGEEDCLRDYRGGLLSYQQYQECLKRYQTPLRIERRPDTDLYSPKARGQMKVLEALLRRGPNEFLSSILNQLLRRELSPKQEAAVRKWLRDPKELELFGGPPVSGEPDPEQDLALQETGGYGSRSPPRRGASRLDVLEALISRKPNNSFIRSIRDQVALGRKLSDNQLRVVYRLLNQVGMDYEADVFRTASSLYRGDIEPSNGVVMLNRIALRKILSSEGLLKTSSGLSDHKPFVAVLRKHKYPTELYEQALSGAYTEYFENESSRPSRWKSAFEEYLPTMPLEFYFDLIKAFFLGLKRIEKKERSESYTPGWRD